MALERVPFKATLPGAAYEGLSGLPAVMLLENLRSMYNVGSIFRTADGAGLGELVLCGITAAPPKKQIAKTALGAEERVRWRHTWDAPGEAERLRGEGYELAAVETSGHAVDLFEWRPRFPVCVLFGHEVEGLSAALLERCDTHVRIPMLGVKHSLNVASAAAVVAYELLRKYRALTGGGS